MFLPTGFVFPCLRGVFFSFFYICVLFSIFFNSVFFFVIGMFFYSKQVVFVFFSCCECVPLICSIVNK